MKVPIQQQGACLIASISSALADDDLTQLRDSLVERIRHSHSRAVIVDVAGLDVMDSFATRTLGDLAAIIRLRGGEMVIAGIQPDVAVAVARLGLKLEAVATVLDLQAGLAYLSQKVRVRASRSGRRSGARLRTRR